MPPSKREQREAAIKSRKVSDVTNADVAAAGYGDVQQALAVVSSRKMRIGDDGSMELGDIRLTPLGIDIPETVNEEQWRLLWNVIMTFDDSIQFMVGDAVVYGQLKFGRTYEDVSAILGGRWKPKTLRNIAHVCSTFPFTSRDPRLKVFSIYRQIAQTDIPQYKRLHWLAYAAEHQPSVMELARLMSGKSAPAAPPKWRTRKDALIGYVTPSRWKQMTPESRREMYNDLATLIHNMETWGID